MENNKPKCELIKGEIIIQNSVFLLLSLPVLLGLHYVTIGLLVAIRYWRISVEYEWNLSKVSPPFMPEHGYEWKEKL